MLGLIDLGINSDGVRLAVNLVLLFLFVLYFALIWWTYSDARSRIEDPMIVACATAASLFPFVGTVVYLILRPPEYLEDVRERELEIAAAEARLAGADHHSCPYCNNEIEKAFLRCPNCMHRLKEPCTTCGKPLDPRWRICPYCEAEVGAQPRPARQRRTRQRQPTAAEAATQASGEQPPRRAPQRPAGEDGPGREPGAPREAAPQPARQGAAPRTEAPAPRRAAPQPEPRQGRPAGQPEPRQRPAGQPEPRQGRPAGAAERPAGDAPRERPTGNRARP